MESTSLVLSALLQQHRRAEVDAAARYAILMDGARMQALDEVPAGARVMAIAGGAFDCMMAASRSFTRLSGAGIEVRVHLKRNSADLPWAVVRSDGAHNWYTDTAAEGVFAYTALVGDDDSAPVYSIEHRLPQWFVGDKQLAAYHTGRLAADVLAQAGTGCSDCTSTTVTVRCTVYAVKQSTGAV